MGIYKDEKRRVKRQKEANEQLGRKMNQDVSGNRMLFCKKVGKQSVEKSRIWVDKRKNGETDSEWG